MKLMISIGLFVGSSLGGWLGSLLDNGNIFGVWGLLFGTLGAFAGIWAGFKVGQSYIG